MKISIKPFLPKEIGYSRQYEMEEKAKFEEFTVVGPVRFDLKMMRLDDGIHVYLEDIEVEVEMTCDKCLKKFNLQIEISEAERIFYLQKPVDYDDEADQADIFMVDMKHQEIDLTELLRQEILLHFPTSQVCSSGCEGFSPESEVSDEGYKPLAGLKDLLG